MLRHEYTMNVHVRLYPKDGPFEKDLFGQVRLTTDRMLSLPEEIRTELAAAANELGNGYDITSDIKFSTFAATLADVVEQRRGPGWSVTMLNPTMNALVQHKPDGTLNCIELT